jgi:hypothetical protein
MADVLNEAAREGYDDALEVRAGWDGDTVGVATFAVDRAFNGTPTGEIDPLPIRLYVLDVQGDLTGEAGRAMTAYLDIEAAEELRDLVDAAVTQVQMTRHHRRRRAVAEPGHERNSRCR